MIRPYAPADESAIAALVDERSDPLWVRQGHSLHGPLLDDGTQWRRTLVAERDERLVGAATVARNRVHPGRLNLAVEVAPRYRQRGVATALVDALRRDLPEPLPLSGKVRPYDPAATGLLRCFDGRVYQHCPAPRPVPSDPAIVAWCAAQSVPPHTSIVALSEVPDDPVELWVEQYTWVHADWSPAAVQPLRELAPEIVADADPHLSVVSVRNGAVVAIAWAFPEDDGDTTIVAETRRRHVSGGIEQVAAALATCLGGLRRRGARAVELDGHASDPHLTPVVASLPAVAADPVDLVEIPSDHVAAPRS